MHPSSAARWVGLAERTSRRAEKSTICAGQSEIASTAAVTECMQAMTAEQGGGHQTHAGDDCREGGGHRMHAGEDCRAGWRSLNACRRGLPSRAAVTECMPAMTAEQG